MNKKQFTLRYVFIYKKPDTLRYILISKKQCTLRCGFTSKICHIVLISNYEKTYDQSDQIGKKLTYLLRIRPILTINK